MEQHTNIPDLYLFFIPSYWVNESFHIELWITTFLLFVLLLSVPTRYLLR